MSAHVVYVIENTETRRVKVGMTRDVQERLSSLQTAHDCKLEVLGLRKCVSRCEAMHIEAAMHNLLRQYRVRGEWFAKEAAPLAILRLSCVDTAGAAAERARVAWLAANPPAA